MSKKFKGGVLILAGLLGLGTITTLASCGEDDSQKEETKINCTKLEITNKAKLQEEWRVGQAKREILLNFTADPAMTQQVAFQKGHIKVTSSDTSVIRVANQFISPAKAGTATITVKAGDKVDSVTITVAEEKISTFEEAYKAELTNLNGGDSVTATTQYATHAVVVATSAHEDFVLYDGANYATVHNKEQCAALKVGDVKLFRYKPSTFKKAVQVAVDNYEDSTKTIAIPEATKFTYSNLKDLYSKYAKPIILDNGNLTEENIIPNYTKITFEAVWTNSDLGKDEKPKTYAFLRPTDAYGSNNNWKEEYKLKVDFPYLKELTKAHDNKLEAKEGDTVKITGVIASYNHFSKYFAMALTDAEVTKPKVDLESIVISAKGTIKPYDQFTLKEEFLPAYSSGEVVYEIAEADKDSVFKRTFRGITTWMITAAREEPYTFKGKDKATGIATNELKITVTGEPDPNNPIAKAETKDYAGLKAAFDACIDSDTPSNSKPDGKLYILEGEVIDVDRTGDNKDKGVIKVKPTGAKDDEIVTISQVGENLNQYELSGTGENQKINRIYNTYKFLDNIIDKQFAVGDIAQFYVYINIYVKDNELKSTEYNAVLKEVITPATSRKFPVELAKGLTSDPIVPGEGIEAGTTLTLTLDAADETKDYHVFLNGVEVAANEAGKYVIKTTAPKTAVTVTTTSKGLVLPITIDKTCGLPTSYSAAGTFTKDTIVYAYGNGISANGGLQSKNNPPEDDRPGKGVLYNKTAFAADIAKIEIYGNSGYTTPSSPEKASKGTFYFTTGKQVLADDCAATETSYAYNSFNNGVITLDNLEAGTRFFRFEHNNKGFVKFDKIVITFKQATPAE